MSLAVLTNAQRRVLEQLAAGMSYGEIALAQRLSVETVRHHVRQACDRLPPDFAPNVGVRTRLLMWYAKAA